MAKAAQRTANPAGAVFESDEEDNIIVNLSEVEEMTFENLPNGIYPVIVEKVEYRLSNASGQPMWSVTLTVEGEGKYRGRKLFANLSFSENALPGTKAAMRILAPDLLEGDFNPKKIADGGDLVGKQVRVKVGTQTYNNEERNNVRSWLPRDAGGDQFIAA